MDSDTGERPSQILLGHGAFMVGELVFSGPSREIGDLTGPGRANVVKQILCMVSSTSSKDYCLLG